jgi:ubiquinone/menaquinone biosynthesis C-methylase UbiE
MSGPIRLFVGSYPEFYDHLLVPVLFAPYARILAERLRGMTVGNVLEIAAGTGVVTRALVHLLPEAVNITATDLNLPMLDRARSHAGMDRVHWQQANALALPFGEHEFDCAICQFGVMFFADKQAAFRETFRVLKQGGRFLFIVWDREEEVGIRSVAAEVMGRLLSRDPASLLPPPYFDLTAARADLEAAGFGAVSIEKLPERSRAKSPQEAAIANCHGGILRTHIEQHAPGRLEEITNAVADALAEKFGAGPIDAPMQAILFTASR